MSDSPMAAIWDGAAPWRGLEGPWRSGLATDSPARAAAARMPGIGRTSSRRRRRAARPRPARAPLADAAASASAEASAFAVPSSPSPSQSPCCRRRVVVAVAVAVAVVRVLEPSGQGSRAGTRPDVDGSAGSAARPPDSARDALPCCRQAQRGRGRRQRCWEAPARIWRRACRMTSRDRAMGRRVVDFSQTSRPLRPSRRAARSRRSSERASEREAVEGWPGPGDLRRCAPAETAAQLSWTSARNFGYETCPAHDATGDLQERRRCSFVFVSAVADSGLGAIRRAALVLPWCPGKKAALRRACRACRLLASGLLAWPPCRCRCDVTRRGQTCDPEREARGFRAGTGRACWLAGWLAGWLAPRRARRGLAGRPGLARPKRARRRHFRRTATTATSRRGGTRSRCSPARAHDHAAAVGRRGRDQRVGRPAGAPATAVAAVAAVAAGRRPHAARLATTLRFGADVWRWERCACAASRARARARRRRRPPAARDARR